MSWYKSQEYDATIVLHDLLETLDSLLTSSNGSSIGWSVVDCVWNLLTKTSADVRNGAREAFLGELALKLNTTPSLLQTILMSEAVLPYEDGLALFLQVTPLLLPTVHAALLDTATQLMAAACCTSINTECCATTLCPGFSCFVHHAISQLESLLHHLSPTPSSAPPPAAACPPLHPQPLLQLLRMSRWLMKTAGHVFGMDNAPASPHKKKRVSPRKLANTQGRSDEDSMMSAVGPPTEYCSARQQYPGLQQASGKLKTLFQQATTQLLCCIIAPSRFCNFLGLPQAAAPAADNGASGSVQSGAQAVVEPQGAADNVPQQASSSAVVEQERVGIECVRGFDGGSSGCGVAAVQAAGPLVEWMMDLFVMQLAKDPELLSIISTYMSAADLLPQGVLHDAGSAAAHDSLVLTVLTRLTCVHLVLNNGMAVAERLQVVSAPQSSSVQLSVSSSCDIMEMMWQAMRAEIKSKPLTDRQRRSDRRKGAVVEVAQESVCLPLSAAAYLMALLQTSLQRAAHVEERSADQMVQLAQQSTMLYTAAIKNCKDGSWSGGATAHDPQSEISACISPRLEQMMVLILQQQQQIDGGRQQPDDGRLQSEPQQQIDGGRQQIDGGRQQPEAQQQAQPQNGVEINSCRKRGRDSSSGAASHQPSSSLIESQDADTLAYEPRAVDAPTHKPNKKRRVQPQAVPEAVAVQTAAAWVGGGSGTGGVGGASAQRRSQMLLQGLSNEMGWWRDEAAWEEYIAGLQTLVEEELQDNVEDYDELEKKLKAKKEKGGKATGASSGIGRRANRVLGRSTDAGVGSVSDDPSSPWQLLCMSTLRVALVALKTAFGGNTTHSSGVGPATQMCGPGGPPSSISSVTDLRNFVDAVMPADVRIHVVHEVVKLLVPSHGRKTWLCTAVGARHFSVASLMLAVAYDMHRVLDCQPPPCRELTSAYCHLLEWLMTYVVAEEQLFPSQDDAVSPLRYVHLLLRFMLECPAAAPASLCASSLQQMMAIMCQPCTTQQNILNHCTALRAACQCYVPSTQSSRWLRSSPLVLHESWMTLMPPKQRRLWLSALIHQLHHLLAGLSLSPLHRVLQGDTTLHSSAAQGGEPDTNASNNTTAAAAQHNTAAEVQSDEGVSNVLEDDMLDAVVEVIKMLLQVVNKEDAGGGGAASAVLRGVVSLVLCCIHTTAHTCSLIMKLMEAPHCHANSNTSSDQQSPQGVSVEDVNEAVVLLHVRFCCLGFWLAESVSSSEKLMLHFADDAAELEALMLAKQEIMTCAEGGQWRSIIQQIKESGSLAVPCDTQPSNDECGVSGGEQQGRRSASRNRRQRGKATQNGLNKSNAGTRGSLGSVNPYIAAARAEDRQHGEDSQTDDDFSDLEDFIVCKPGRDYNTLLADKFTYTKAE